MAPWQITRGVGGGSLCGQAQFRRILFEVWRRSRAHAVTWKPWDRGQLHVHAPFVRARRVAGVAPRSRETCVRALIPFGVHSSAKFSAQVRESRCLLYELACLNMICTSSVLAPFRYNSY